MGYIITPPHSFSLATQFDSTTLPLTKTNLFSLVFLFCILLENLVFFQLVR
jgi:hypothetical protein